MSASSLVAIGAPVKLWIIIALFIWCSFCCFIQQSSFYCSPTVSMRLRPKRTCSGFESFGCFHIQISSPIHIITNQSGLFL